MWRFESIGAYLTSRTGMIPGNLSLNPHASLFDPIDAPSVKAPWG